MEKTNKPLVYLATPYSFKHDDPAIKAAKEEERFERANRIGAMLTKKDLTIFSPISMAHPMNKYGLPGNWEFWAKFDEAFISCCYKMIVICADGWLDSIGVDAELQLARKFKIPVEFVDEDGNPYEPTMKIHHTSEDGRYSMSTTVQINMMDFMVSKESKNFLKDILSKNGIVEHNPPKILKSVQK